jgi:hypothetical protein
MALFDHLSADQGALLMVLVVALLWLFVGDPLCCLWARRRRVAAARRLLEARASLAVPLRGGAATPPVSALSGDDGGLGSDAAAGAPYRGGDAA